MKVAESGKAPSIRDPLIDDVRIARKELCASFDNNLEKLCAHLRAIEKQHATRLVTRCRGDNAASSGSTRT